MGGASAIGFGDAPDGTPGVLLTQSRLDALGGLSALRLKSRLLFTPGVMVTSVPWQLRSSELAINRDA